MIKLTITKYEDMSEEHRDMIEKILDLNEDNCIYFIEEFCEQCHKKCGTYDIGLCEECYNK